MSEKSLQKLTLKELIKLDVIPKDVALKLDDGTLKEIRTYIQEKRDEDPKLHSELVEWAWNTFSIDMRNRLYDYNHKCILAIIHTYVDKNGAIPSASEIAKESNLSRQTVTKHLSELNSSPLMEEQKAKYTILRETVMATVYRLAVEGDLKACKLFLEQSGGITSSNIQTYIDKQQNNY